MTFLVLLPTNSMLNAAPMIFNQWQPKSSAIAERTVFVTSIKYKVERDKQYLPYIELGRWLCSHFQLETPLNFHKPITQKLYNLEK